MDPDHRDALLEAHRKLEVLGVQLGVKIPPLESRPAEAVKAEVVAGVGGKFKVFSFSKISEAVDEDPILERETQNGVQAEKAAKISLAEAEFENHDPLELSEGRGEWLWFSVPETPVAGAHCAVYFNKGVSEALKFRPAVQIHRAFNEWELESETLALKPTVIPREDGSDWWTCDFLVPRESFEMNFVFTDGEGAFDNNYGQDFLSPVHWGISRDEWLDGANARAAAEMERRMAEEKSAAEDAERIRQKQMEQQDLDKANWRIGEIKACYQNWQEGRIS